MFTSKRGKRAKKRKMLLKILYALYLYLLSFEGYTIERHILFPTHIPRELLQLFQNIAVGKFL